MLPKENRLTRMKDFEILFKEGYFVGGNVLTLKIWKIDPHKYPKRAYSSENLLIGFVVPMKVSKSAVKRNRIKRQMREVVRLLLQKNQIQNGFMIVIMAKSGVLSAEYDLIENDIMLVLRRAGVFK